MTTPARGTDAFVAALRALRAALPSGFRYRGFAPRRPPILAEEEALVPELVQGAHQAARGPLGQKLRAEAPELAERLILRVVRIALVEEACLGGVVGADGRPIPPSRGATVGRRALRRIVDEAQEDRAEVPWQLWPAHEVVALERLAQRLGTRVQALCAERLGPLRLPLEQRRVAHDEAAAIVLAIEKGQPWC